MTRAAIAGLTAFWFIMGAGFGFGLCVLLPSSVSAADTISGQARVIDGDTIEVNGQIIRFHGIDALEDDQMCTTKARGREWNCGQAATKLLEMLIGESSIRCHILGTDRYNRYIGKCYRDGTDLAPFMVTNGLALAYRRYSDEYVAFENAARATPTGAWASEFMKPWEWRKSKSERAAQ